MPKSKEPQVINSSRFTNFIREQYPHLSDKQLAASVKELEETIVQHLRKGEALAFLTRREDGTYDVTVYSWLTEAAEKVVRRRKQE